MDFAGLKDWLVPVSSALGIVSLAITSALALREYKLKARAEARLADSARVESDIKLLTLFVDIMDIAHARGQSVVVSEKMFEALAPRLQAAGITDPKSAAYITLPVGFAAQDAAIAAIAVLGKKHSILFPVALRALESLNTFKANIVGPLLEDLRRHPGAADGD
jgi:hypothetical protein